MSHKFWQRVFSTLLLAGMLLNMIAPMGALAAPAAQQEDPASKTPERPLVGTSLTNPVVTSGVRPADTTGMAPAKTVNPFTGAPVESRNALPMPKSARGNSGAGVLDSVAQLIAGPDAMPAPIVNWEAQDVNDGGGYAPPDTDGQVGPNHYIQMVNVTTAIYDKTGVLLYGPFLPGDLWPGGDPCNNDHGDPVVLYDQMADRWLLTQFSINGPYYQCIAVSKGPNPTNNPNDWWLYSFLVSSTKMNDYPKLGVWPDGYYMTANQFTGGASWGGLGVWSFERDEMLAGNAAQMIYFDMYTVNQNYGGALPSNLMGDTLPPAGAPNIFAEVDYDWIGAQDILTLWEFHSDWVTPANSTFTLANEIPVADFDAELCTAPRGACIDQPGTSNRLEAIADRLMMHLWYPTTAITNR